MIDEPLTDAERRFLLRLAIVATQEVPDPLCGMLAVNLVAKLSGTDTQIIARRAYPAKRYEKEEP
jgi:hypothetical protein